MVGLSESESAWTKQDYYPNPCPTHNRLRRQHRTGNSYDVECSGSASLFLLPCASPLSGPRTPSPHSYLLPQRPCLSSPSTCLCLPTLPNRSIESMGAYGMGG